MKLAYELAKAVRKYIAVRSQSIGCISFASHTITLEGKGEWSQRRSLALHLGGRVIGEHVFDPPNPCVCRLVAA